MQRIFKGFNQAKPLLVAVGAAALTLLNGWFAFKLFPITSSVEALGIRVSAQETNYNDDISEIRDDIDNLEKESKDTNNKVIDIWKAMVR